MKKTFFATLILLLAAMFAQGQTINLGNRSAPLPEGVTRFSKDETDALAGRVQKAKRVALTQQLEAEPAQSARRPKLAKLVAADSGFVYAQAPAACWVASGISLGSGTIYCAPTQNLTNLQLLVRIVTGDGQEMTTAAYSYDSFSVGWTIQLWQGPFYNLPGPVTFEMFVVTDGPTTLASVTIDAESGQAFGGPLTLIDLGRGSTPTLICNGVCALQIPYVPFGGSGPIQFQSVVASAYGAITPLPVAQTGLINPTIVGPIQEVQFPQGEGLWVICAQGVCSQRGVFLSLPSMTGGPGL